MDELRLSESFASYLVETGVIDPQAALAALDARRKATPPIGRLALKHQLLTMKQVCRVLAEQVDTGLRFGEQAVAMGYMHRGQLDHLLDIQRKAQPGLSEILLNLGLVDAHALKDCREAFVESLVATLV